MVSVVIGHPEGLLPTDVLEPVCEVLDVLVGLFVFLFVLLFHELFCGLGVELVCVEGKVCERRVDVCLFQDKDVDVCAGDDGSIPLCLEEDGLFTKETAFAQLGDAAKLDGDHVDDSAGDKEHGLAHFVFSDNGVARGVDLGAEGRHEGLDEGLCVGKGLEHGDLAENVFVQVVRDQGAEVLGKVHENDLVVEPGLALPEVLVVGADPGLENGSNPLVPHPQVDNVHLLFVVGLGGRRVGNERPDVTDNGGKEDDARHEDQKGKGQLELGLRVVVVRPHPCEERGGPEQGAEVGLDGRGINVVFQALGPARVARVGPVPVVGLVGQLDNVEKDAGDPVGHGQDTQNELDDPVKDRARRGALPPVEKRGDAVEEPDPVDPEERVELWVVGKGREDAKHVKYKVCGQVVKGVERPVRDHHAQNLVPHEEPRRNVDHQKRIQRVVEKVPPHPHPKPRKHHPHRNDRRIPHCNQKHHHRQQRPELGVGHLQRVQPPFRREHLSQA